MRVAKGLVVVLMITALFSCNTNSVTNKSLETELDSVSYAIGLDMAVKLKANFAEADKELFMQGYRNGMDSISMLINEKDVNTIINSYFKNKQQRDAAKKAEETYGEVKKEGEAFLAENKSKDGVITTDSGFQYEVINEGTGEKPVATDKVKLHYHGTLTDGTVFDSSVDKEAPITHNANGFVKGFNEGLLLMNVGSKYKFYIPQELGYGASPRPGGPIKPFSVIIFEVELLEIK